LIHRLIHELVRSGAFGFQKAARGSGLHPGRRTCW